jgi:hypothetical protein
MIKKPLMFLRKSLGLIGVLGLLSAVLPTMRAQDKPLIVEHGKYTVHMLLHAIGTEEYTVTEPRPGHFVMTTTWTASDRGTKRTTFAALEMSTMYVPTRLQQILTPANPDGESLTVVKGNSVVAREGSANRTMAKPAVAFMGFGTMPAAVQAMMMRYWEFHHQPARLPMLRASDKAPPLEIKLVGHDVFSSKGRMVRLTRYTVGNLMFGREIVWMNESNRLAALMTFAGGLPQEEVLDGYQPVEDELERSGVRQEMLDLDDLDRQVPLEATGSFAIVGARLIDGTGAPAVEDSAVIVRDGRITAVGAMGTIHIPVGMRVIHAEGRSLLPGLWEMHSHYSGVEFGPALLAAGVTTARDCGGESEFLTTVRSKIDKDHALGPKLLLAGLIDSGGPLGFGYVNVQTPTEGVEAVDAYADAKFDQIKVYTQIQPDVLKAITAEAHTRGLTVTGHVPAAINTFDAIADGMDQINHLQYVTRAIVPDAGEASEGADRTAERAADCA